MNPKTVRRLTDMQIDEISLVDRPANQHGMVAITKRDEENEVAGIYDASGAEVDPDSLEHGDVVYDEEGNEFIAVEDTDDEGEGDDEGEYETSYEEALEPELVGKASVRVASRPPTFGDRGRKAFGQARTKADALNVRAGKATRRNPGRALGLAGAGGTTLGYAGGRRRVEKSLGQSVYEDLSKALSDSDRDEVIAKAMDEVSKRDQLIASLQEQVDSLNEQSEYEHYVEVAKGYGLPGDPERLAGILKNAVDTLPQNELDELDRILTSQGALYDEIGASGTGQDNEIMDVIQTHAMQAVGKSGVSMEQATVALFEANPGAYDDYLSLNG